jgi:hypothetical protein
MGLPTDELYDPNVQELITGFEALLADGVHTEVKLYDREIFVNISGVKSKVSHIDYDSLY